MARINLLPWRAERRKQRQKEFGVMLGGAAVAAVALSFLIITFYNGQISGQGERNAFLSEQITQLDKQIVEIEQLDKNRAKLLARKEVIEQLQANRSQMVHLFDSLVRTIPDGVVLTSIKQDDIILTLEGRSQSNARVSAYMRQLEGSGWMTNPDLSIIEAKGTDKGLPYEFKLQVKLANPNAPRDEDGDGVPDAPAAVPAELIAPPAGPVQALPETTQPTTAPAQTVPSQALPLSPDAAPTPDATPVAPATLPATGAES